MSLYLLTLSELLGRKCHKMSKKDLSKKKGESESMKGIFLLLTHKVWNPLKLCRSFTKHCLCTHAI